MVPARKGVCVYTEVLARKEKDGGGGQEHELKLQVKESDLVVDDSMLAAVLKVEMKDGVAAYRLTSKNKKTIATVLVQVESAQGLW